MSYFADDPGIRGFRRDQAFSWPLFRMSDLVKLNYGKALTSSSRLPGQIPVYGSNGITGSHSTALNHGPTVILGRKGQGPLGVKWHDGPFWVIDTAYYVTFIDKRLTPRFFYYFTDYVGLNHLKDGTSNPSLTRATFGSQQMALPPLPEQRRIAAVLGALDDKIELNGKMNRTLEEMAQALFKSWFIDFDGHDDFEGSELGPIPRGWTVRPLLDVVRLVSGGTPKTSTPEFWNGPIKWTSAKDVSNAGHRYLIDTERTITRAGLERSPAKIIPAGSVVVIARGATCGRWCLLGEDMAMNQTCYAIVADSDELGTYAKHLVPALLGGLVQQAHGSIFDTITTSTFATAKAAIPPESLILKFHDTIRGMEARILSNVYESRTLAELRDTLLPKLISGELRVPEAEALTSDLP